MKGKSPYVPEAGDLIWVTLDPQVGREQAGRRPAIVISPSSYNRKTGLFVGCPITSQVKGYPFEVSLPEGLDISGAVLSDQVKNLDWKGRRATYIGKVPPEVLHKVVRRIIALIAPGS